MLYMRNLTGENHTVRLKCFVLSMISNVVVLSTLLGISTPCFLDLQEDYFLSSPLSSLLISHTSPPYPSFSADDLDSSIQLFLGHCKYPWRAPKSEDAQVPYIKWYSICI